LTHDVDCSIRILAIYYHVVPSNYGFANKSEVNCYKRSVDVVKVSVDSDVCLNYFMNANNHGGYVVINPSD